MKLIYFVALMLTLILSGCSTMQHTANLQITYNNAGIQCVDYADYYRIDDQYIHLYNNRYELIKKMPRITEVKITNVRNKN